MRLFDRAHDVLRDPRYILGLCHIGQDHRELVATEARHRIRPANGLGDRTTGGTQESVAGGMPMKVVVHLEIVYVDKENGDAFVVSPGPG
jgi:hypothetical protein